MSGLTHDKGRGNDDGAGDHARSASVFLTGAQPRKAPSNLRSGISVDQLAALQIGQHTRFASLVLGCEPGKNSGECDQEYSCAYSNNISWSSPASPRPKETNPRVVFDRLFAADTRQVHSPARRSFEQSILDFVADDARRMHRRLGRQDRRKLDEYLTGVREIEHRIGRVEREDALLASDVSWQYPENAVGYRARARLMCDMMVLAFQADLTRIATCMFENAATNRSYPEAGVNEGHHTLSHHGGDRRKHEKLVRINRFHVAQLAYFLERLRSIREGDGTLLDQCMVVYGSAISDGDRHNNDNLPVLLAGRGGGTIAPGRHLRYLTETPMNNLLLSLLDRLDVRTDWFGDSTGRLPYLDG